jgi:uncharacterized protein YjbI with pentapeptide repeats
MSPSDKNDPPAREEFSFGGSSFFGYEKIVRQGDRFTLEGEDAPTLHQGMMVELQGDSQGYVPGGFRHGEKAKIVAFRQPFEEGSSDHIIEVSTGEGDGWVKPSNIARPPRQAQETQADRILDDSANLAPVPDEAAADPKHIELLRKGVGPWNNWRAANPDENPRLSGADLRGIDLRHVNLQGADLSSIEGYGIDLYHANLRSANLRRAFLQSAKLFKADMSGADLTRASLSHADLGMARLRKATLRDATCMWCDFGSADFSRSDLSFANLNYSRLFDVNLSGATLVETSLMATLLIRVNLKSATLQGCRVHGAAVWKIQTDEHTTQANLIVTDFNDPTVTTDSLEIAQLIHLLINAAAIRDVINSMTGRAVLLLGRFTPERMEVLSGIAGRLRELGDLPIIFNFDKPVDRSVSETIRILAGLSKFIVADLTDPKSSPYEAHLTIPDMAVPVLPIIQQDHSAFSMFEDLYDYDWLLEGFEYKNTAHLLKNLKSLREEAVQKREAIRARRSKRRDVFRTELPGPEPKDTESRSDD